MAELSAHQATCLNFRPDRSAPLLGLQLVPSPDGATSAERIYTCSKCGRVFQYPQSLNRHKWKCEGLRVLTCPHCDYATHRLDSLKAHVGRHGPELALPQPLSHEGLGEDSTAEGRVQGPGP